MKTRNGSVREQVIVENTVYIIIVRLVINYAVSDCGNVSGGGMLVM